ncbi:MAG: hypothetical protein R2728_00715 [Chitinophagales bacterium]
MIVDRSVGHIDCTSEEFATFVDVLPKWKMSKISFKKEAFEKVYKLFVENI